jgi:hypothetical protein
VTVVEESDQLHERVRRFALERASGSDDEFASLALEIARFQARWSPGMARLIEARKSRLDSVASIPAVPSDAFRLTRVAVHPPELDAVRFVTSGTTSGAPGTHVMRTTRTYEQLSLDHGARALTSAWPGPRVLVALAPPPAEPASSSLGFMMARMMERFDGQSLTAGKRFRPHGPDRWLVRDSGVDLVALRRAAAIAAERDQPLLVLATSFALVMLLDALGRGIMESPARTVVMQTGGFKGRTRELDAADLRAAVARAFGVPEAHVIGEYGMTELTSQLYEGTLPGGSLAGEPGVYLEPHWLRVAAVDPATLEPVADGEVGLARFVDLGNVDSAVAIVTQDLVRRRAGGIELLGRRPGSPPRGCSLALEELLVR